MFGSLTNRKLNTFYFLSDKVAADDLKLYPEHHKADMFFGYATAAGFYIFLFALFVSIS